MTRLRARAAMGVGGVMVGGLIWGTAVFSQDDRKPPVPGAAIEVRPDEPKAPAADPPTGTTGALGRPATLPQPRVDPNPPVAAEAGSAAGPGRGVSPAASLRPGESATERAKRQAVQSETFGPTEGSGVFLFGARIPDMPSPQQAVKAETPSLRMFRLKRANARALKEIVETLVPSSRGHVAIDAATNTVILRAPDSVFADVEPLINELDSLEVRRAEPFGAGAAKGRRVPGGSGLFGGTGPRATGGPGVGGFGGTPAGANDRGPGGGMGGLGDPLVQQPSPPATSASDLRSSYERADKAARDLAATMKTHSYDDSKRAELRNKVSYAFSLRQTLVQLELAEMQRRIEAIQESIDLRYKLTAQIVDRRVSELLDPNLQWEPASTSAIGTGGSMDANEVQRRRLLDQELRSGLGPWSGVQGLSVPAVDPGRGPSTTAPTGAPSAGVGPVPPTNGSSFRGTGTGTGEGGERSRPGTGAPPSSSNSIDGASIVPKAVPGAGFGSSIKPQAPSGTFRDRESLMSDDVDNSLFPFRVDEGTIETDVAIRDVQFGTISPGQSKSVNLVIRGKKPFKIDEFYREKKENSKIQDASFTVEVDTLTVKPIHVLPMSFTAPDITGEFEEEFVVKIADRAEPLSFKARGRIGEQTSAARQ